MIIRETKEQAEIACVLFHPEIKSRIADDNSPEIEIPITDEYQYLVGEVDSTIIGLIVLHPYRDGLEVHYQVLPEYRKDYAVELAHKVLERLKGYILYGLVPTCYPDVLAFDRKIGFKHVETLNDTFVKDGQAYPYHIMRLENGIY